VTYDAARSVLRFNPLPELSMLRTRVLSRVENVTITPNQPLVLHPSPPRQGHDGFMHVDSASSTTTMPSAFPREYELQVVFTVPVKSAWSGDEGGFGTPITLGVSVFEGGNQTTRAFFSLHGVDPTPVQSLSVNTLNLDLTQSQASPVQPPAEPTASTQVSVTAADTELMLRVFVDRSIVEVFANDGQATLTGRAFPDAEKATGVSVFSSGAPVFMKSVTLWGMASIWANTTEVH
jgi:hypothetical protein